MHKCLIQNPQEQVSIITLLTKFILTPAFERWLRNSRYQALMTRDIFLSIVIKPLSMWDQKKGILPSYLQTYFIILGC